MTLKRGNLCEGLVTAKLLELGYEVLHPFGSGCVYDLVVDVKGNLRRLQVKSTQSDPRGKGRKARERVKLMRGYRRRESYPIGSIDFFVIVDQAKVFYVIPFSDWKEIHNVTIGIHARLNQYNEAWDLLAA